MGRTSVKPSFPKKDKKRSVLLTGRKLNCLAPFFLYFGSSWNRRQRLDLPALARNPSLVPSSNLADLNETKTTRFLSCQSSGNKFLSCQSS